jgi:DNA-binding MarR family transcriptional regulator
MSTPDTNDFSFAKLERVIHERARLSILSSLASHADGLIFNDIKRYCALTDGNLSRQLSLLEQEGFVEIWKGQRNNRPCTLVKMTETGRRRFMEYIAELERIVQQAGQAAPAPEGKPRTA